MKRVENFIFNKLSNSLIVFNPSSSLHGMTMRIMNNIY